MNSCPKCNCEDVVRNGRIKGRQRYKCRKCGYQFTRSSTYKKLSDKEIYAIVEFCQYDISTNGVAKMFNISPNTVKYWVNRLDYYPNRISKTDMKKIAKANILLFSKGSKTRKKLEDIADVKRPPIIDGLCE